MIVGQNSLLNQYVPTFQIKCLLDGQILVYDSCKKAFVNMTPIGGGGGAETLGQLLDVNDSVDNPLTLFDGQALVYDGTTGLWINQYIDYNTLANIPPTTLTGDVIGTGIGTIPTTLLTVNPTVGTFGSDILVPQITVDAKGRITNVINIPISGSGIGTVTSVSASGTQGVTTTVINPTTTPHITIGLGDIFPSSITTPGNITGSNISGTNTGDQIIVLTGDATNSDTSTGGVLTLATVNATPGIYGDDHFVPTITVNAKGLVTSVTTQHVDTSVRDLVPDTETLTIAARHQYIVTTELQVDGYIINNGVIAIL